MAGSSEQSNLFPDHQAARDGTIVVNERCLVRSRGAHRVVVVSGVVLAQYTAGDHMAEAHAMVSLCEQGWADQNDVARAFGCTSRTVQCHQDRFAESGLAALGRGGEFPRGRHRLHPSRVRLVGRLKSEGLSNRAIAAQIGVTEKAVRKLVPIDARLVAHNTEIGRFHVEIGDWEQAVSCGQTVPVDVQRRLREEAARLEEQRRRLVGRA